MYVSLEMVYLCQSYFLSNDLNLYDPTSDTPAECHTSGASADLGQVQYILSDKTGTLTKNLMVVKQFSVAKKMYGEPLVVPDHDGFKLNSSPSSRPSSGTGATFSGHTSFNSMSALREEDLSSLEESTLKLDFIRVLAYCHTAMLMPDERGEVNIRNDKDLENCLQAESPDEVALILSIAQECGVLLVKKDDNEMESVGLHQFRSKSGKINFSPRERVELLAVNEFDSDRKMMSVLIRSPNDNNRLMLLCKGADSSMLRSCNIELNPFTQICVSHIEAFASTGLRTLVAGCRNVSEEEAVEWMKEYRDASNSIYQRNELLFKCAKKIEKNMKLVGAIGIEDGVFSFYLVIRSLSKYP